MNANVSSPAACRFFTPEDVVRWALAAYYGASRDVEPPPGVPWLDPEFGQSWASPASFGDAVHMRFTNALVAAAIDARLPCDHGCASATFSWDDSGFFSRLQGNDLPPLADSCEHPSHGALRHA